jgi:hypothetical protein
MSHFSVVKKANSERLRTARAGTFEVANFAISQVAIGALGKLSQGKPVFIARGA